MAPITRADVLTLFVQGLTEELPAQYSPEQIREIAEEEVSLLRHKLVVAECDRDEALGKLDYWRELVKEAAITKIRLSDEIRKHKEACPGDCNQPGCEVCCPCRCAEYGCDDPQLGGKRGCKGKCGCYACKRAYKHYERSLEG